MINVNNLRKTYSIREGILWGKRQRVQALRGVSFSIEQGETLALVGESGSGKSTLARVITLLEPFDDGSEMTISNRPITWPMGRNRMKLLRPQVQMVFQNPFLSLNPRKRIGDSVAQPLILNPSYDQANTRQSVKQAVAKTLADVGLDPEVAVRYPHMFSGGQRQRIAIARALMTRPYLLVLDEPVSALDVSIQSQILNLLNDIQYERGLSYLLISHDLNVVKSIADRVMVMYLGEIVEIGPVKEVFARPLHPYTQGLLAASPDLVSALNQRRLSEVQDKSVHSRKSSYKPLSGELPSAINPPTGCAFHPRCAFAQDICKIKSPMPETHHHSQVACHRAKEFAHPA